MIPAKHKIPKKIFTQYLRGKHIPFSLGVIIITKKPTLPTGFAVVISKKICQKAHDRNMIKRFFYHVLRKNMSFFTDNSTSVVVLLKTKILDVDRTIYQQKQNLEQEITTICLK